MKCERVIAQQPQYLYTLTLTQYEAEALMCVCGNISGPYDGPRGVTSKIYELLTDFRVSTVNQPKPKRDMAF